MDAVSGAIRVGQTPQWQATALWILTVRYRALCGHSRSVPPLAPVQRQQSSTVDCFWVVQFTSVQPPFVVPRARPEVQKNTGAEWLVIVGYSIINFKKETT